MWLVYRCGACDATWNRPVHERVAPASLGARLERYHANDPELARAVGLHPCSGMASGDAAIEGPADLPLRATLVVEHPVATRLDRLIAAHLGLPRRAVAQLVDDPRPLRRPPRDGVVISLGGCRRRR